MKTKQIDFSYLALKNASIPYFYSEKKYFTILSSDKMQPLNELLPKSCNDIVIFFISGHRGPPCHLKIEAIFLFTYKDL